MLQLLWCSFNPFIVCMEVNMRTNMCWAFKSNYIYSLVHWGVIHCKPRFNKRSFFHRNLPIFFTAIWPIFSSQFGQFFQNMFSYSFNVAKYLLAKCEICAQRFSNSTGNLGVVLNFKLINLLNWTDKVNLKLWEKYFWKPMNFRWNYKNWYSYLF